MARLLILCGFAYLAYMVRHVGGNLSVAYAGAGVSFPLVSALVVCAGIYLARTVKR